MGDRGERGERLRAANKVRAGTQARIDQQQRENLGINAPLFNPKADISKGIARRAIKGDPWDDPDAYRPLPGAPIDANAGRTASTPLTAKQAREKVSARRYPAR